MMTESEKRQLDVTHKVVLDLLDYARGLDQRIVALESRLVSPPETASVDDDVLAADSATRVYKALERELKLDRRTILSHVSRLVQVYGLERTYGPQWSTSVRLAKDMATRRPDGRTALAHGLDSLQHRDAQRLNGVTA